jgi:hypothetical protein
MIDRIEPGLAIGRLRLGMSREEVLAICGTPVRVRGRQPEALTILDFGLMRVGLNGWVATMLIAEDATAGETSDGIAVGSSWARLVAVRGEPTYEIEETGSWVDALEPGIWYDIARPLQPGEETLDPPFGGEHQVIEDPEHAFVRRIYVMAVK